MSSSAEQQRRRQQASSNSDPSRRGPAPSSSSDASRRAPAPSSSSAPAPRRPAASTSASGPAPTSTPAPYDDDGPAPPEAPIDDYDRMEDSRDDEIAQHWEKWYQLIEEDYTYPVVISDDVANDIFRVLGSEPPQFSVPRKPRLGDGLGGQSMSNVRVILIDGDSLDDIKDAFRGKKATVVVNKEERSAFVPSRLRSSAAAELQNAPPPVPAPVSQAQLPIRGGPSTAPAAQPAPRREERREERRDDRGGDPRERRRGGNNGN
ncbi:hypothetical protein B0I37DRAFT_360839 [Chaetomium sp. MPI-CAGE-AT-0009]|nr:hypothetical protein B0I37DRAFT_360839 [Chaetomium sp. MPI-CAGE-AT-0009]